MIDIRIERAVLDRFPGLGVAAFEAESLDRVWMPSGGLDGFWIGAADMLRLRGVGAIDKLGEISEIGAWRNAATSSGLKPSAFRSSIESLARRILKGETVHTGLPAVDAYCAVSALHFHPMGGYDLDRLPVQRIELRHARAGDHFAPLGGRAEDMPLKERVVVYAAGDTVLCYHFNHRDSRETSLIEGTRRAVFIGETLDALGHHSLFQALDTLSKLLAEVGAKVTKPTLISEILRPADHSPPYPLR